MCLLCVVFGVTCLLLFVFVVDVVLLCLLFVGSLVVVCCSCLSIVVCDCFRLLWLFGFVSFYFLFFFMRCLRVCLFVFGVFVCCLFFV